MKVERKQNTSIFFATNKNLAIWDFFSLKFGEFESFLPLENLCIGQNHIFQVEFW
jgi:hypothetical protein